MTFNGLLDDFEHAAIAAHLARSEHGVTDNGVAAARLFYARRAVFEAFNAVVRCKLVEKVGDTLIPIPYKRD